METRYIPGKPWNFVTSSFLENLDENAKKYFLKSQKLVSVRSLKGKTIISGIFMKFIESTYLIDSANEGRLTVLGALKRIIEMYHPDYTSLEGLVKDLESGMNIENMYKNDFDMLGRLVLKDYIEKNIEDYKAEYLYWIQDKENDLVGELFEYYARALGCRIYEYTFIFDVDCICYNERLDKERSVHLYRFGDDYYVFMSIQEMENLELDVHENSYMVSR